MTHSLKTACVQMTSGPDVTDNLRQAETLIRDAAGKGATLIATPENTCSLRAPSIPFSERLEGAYQQDTHPGVPFFAALAAELSLSLLIGSMSVRVGDRIANRSFLFSPAGGILATYDKIHLFDVDLPTGDRYRESASVAPGGKAIVAQMPGCRMGLSICYDLRFPHLYRSLAKAGADILAVPAAFTVPTGQAHWETLLRARAIENGAFVIAPAQVGQHEGGRMTYGHSLIIAPWGEVLADAGGDSPGIILADLDLSSVAKARGAIPALTHDRDFSF